MQNIKFSFWAFVERIGGMVAAPRQTLDTHIQSKKGGWNDFFIILFIYSISIKLMNLGRAGWTLIDISIVSGLMMFIQILARVMIIPLGAVVLLSVILQFLTKDGPRIKHLDLVGLCAIPALFIQIIPSLLALFIPQMGSPIIKQIILAISALYFIALIFLARNLLLEKRPSK